MDQFWRTSALTGIVLFLECCLFYLLFRIVGFALQGPEAGLPFWLVFVALVWAFLLSFYLQTIRFSLNLRGVFGLGISLVSVLTLAHLNTHLGFFPLGKILGGDGGIAFRLVLTLVFLIILWWRGGSLAHDEVSLDTISSSFRWGLGMIMAAVVVDSLTSARIVSGFLVVGFFGLGLAGMSLARFSSETSNSGAMSVNWLVPIGVSVGAVLVLGLLISALGMGGLDDVTRGIAGFVGTVALWIMKPFLLGLGYLVGLLVQFGNWLTSVFGGGDLSGLQEAQEGINAFRETIEAESEGAGPPELLVWLLKLAVFLASSFLAGLLLFRIFRFRRFLRRRGDVEETRESFFTWERAGQDLSGLFNEWWHNLVNAATQDKSRMPEPKTPREFYHRLLEMSGRLGRPRREAQTPSEHQRTLGDLLPPEPVGRIVEDFQAAYYGGNDTDPSELERLRQSWTVIRSRLPQDEPEGK